MRTYLAIDNDISREINLILEEYNNAVFKHPEFVRSILEANAILVEEVGEVSKAIMEANRENIKTEIAQVAAVCIRMLEYLEQNNL